MEEVADEDPDGGFIAVRLEAIQEPKFGPVGLVAWNCSRHVKKLSLIVDQA